MRFKTILLFLPVIAFTSFATVHPVTPLTIDPSVTMFDSIPQVTTDRTFYVNLATDSSQERTATGIIGSTRVRRGKMAPIICDPRPADAVRKSVENLLAARRLGAGAPETATHTLTCTILDFSLKETIKNLTQTMEADVAIEIRVTNINDTLQSMKYIFRAKNSKSTLDTSKYAAVIIRGAVESALKEIITSITRR